MAAPNYSVPSFWKFISVPSTGKMPCRIPWFNNGNIKNWANQIPILLFEAHEHDVPRKRAPHIFKRLVFQWKFGKQIIYKSQNQRAELVSKRIPFLQPVPEIIVNRIFRKSRLD